MSSLRTHSLGFAAASIAAGAAALMATSGGVQTGLCIGLGAGALSGAFSLAYVVRSAEKSVQHALLAVVAGFLGRIVLVAGALVLAHQSHAAMLPCAGGFFGLYAVGQLLEIDVISARARAQERQA
jgi:hypothetical protein